MKVVINIRALALALDIIEIVLHFSQSSPQFIYLVFLAQNSPILKHAKFCKNSWLLFTLSLLILHLVFFFLFFLFFNCILRKNKQSR